MLSNERIKLKRNKLILTCSVIGILLPIMLICSDLYYLNKGILVHNSAASWVIGITIICQVLIYPILSGFIITFLVQIEYADNTLINTITAPVQKVKFLFGKIIVWFIFHMLLTVVFLLITLAGVYLLYGYPEFLNCEFQTINHILITGLLDFLTLTPVVWIAILQRKTFYPSLIFCCICIGIGFAGLYWPISLSRVVPWSAATVLSVTVGQSNGLTPYVSIISCSVIGLLLGIYSFKHQDF